MKLHSLMLSHVRQNAPDALLTVSDAPWPRAVILAGLGGVGKASLTSEYAHHADYARVVVGLLLVCERAPTALIEAALLSSTKVVHEHRIGE